MEQLTAATAIAKAKELCYRKPLPNERRDLGRCCTAMRDSSGATGARAAAPPPLVILSPCHALSLLLTLCLSLLYLLSNLYSSLSTLSLSHHF